MGICNQCIYFRRVKPASQLLAGAFSTTDAAVANALTKVVEDEQKQRDAEAEFKRLQESTNQELWSTRPVMSDFCGLQESDGVFLIAEIKNRGAQCEDFQQGRPERRPCSTCAHRVAPTGDEQDRELEIAYTKMSAESIAVSASTSSSDSLLNKHREGMASRKAFELSGAYAAKGVLAIAPNYLHYCRKFSFEDEYVLCIFQNPHHTCNAWEEALVREETPDTPKAAMQPPALSNLGNPPDNEDVTSASLQASDPLRPGNAVSAPDAVALEPPAASGVVACDAPTVSDQTVTEFRSFVEWMLEIDLTPEQEAKLGERLTAEWAEGDQDTMTLVEANLATFRSVQGADAHRREEWRQQNRSAFIRILEQYGDEFGAELVDIYNKSPRMQGAETPSLGIATGQNMTTGQAVMGLLGLIGGAAIAAISKRSEASTSAREEVESEGGTKVTQLMDQIFEAQRKEEEELMKTDPTLALQKKLQNQQNNAMMISNWSRVNGDISKHIIGNIR